MAEWKMWFVLLLPLHLCLDTNETLYKTIGRETDVTPVCATATLHFITLIVCRIRTKGNRGECRLLYRPGQDFVRECNPRMTLVTENEAVYLHLSSLKPVDSGTYTCECSHVRGTDTLELIVTVRGSNEGDASTTKLLYVAVAGTAAAFVTVTGVVLGLVLKKTCLRGDTRSGPTEAPVRDPSSLNHGDADNTYASLRQPGGDFYQTISSTPNQCDDQTASASSNAVTARSDQDRKETEQIYEVL